MGISARYHLVPARSIGALVIVLSSVAGLVRAEETQDPVMPKLDPNSPLALVRAKESREDGTPSNDPKMVAGQSVPASELPSAPDSGEMTFVFSDFTVPVYPGWDSCPKGWAYTNKEQYVATLPNAEQARLLKPENEIELTDKWKLDSAPGDRANNVCTNYNEFPERALQFQVEGDIALGLNLDDDSADDPYVCKHDNFTSPLGETGIDNQVYRALGCTRTYRGPDGGDGEIVVGYTGNVATGQFTVVMLLQDVDSLLNDDNVEVILASSDEQPIIDARQTVLSRVSFHVSETPKFRNVLRGSIVDGVLMTEPKDILLERSAGGYGGGTNWDLERARLRFAFRPDGSLEGLLGGYELPFEQLRQQVGGGRGTAHTGGMDCAAKWNTLQVYADGGRDPKTGQCTRISNAHKIKAVPAFVFDRPTTSQANK